VDVDVNTVRRSTVAAPVLRTVSNQSSASKVDADALLAADGTSGQKTYRYVEYRGTSEDEDGRSESATIKRRRSATTLLKFLRLSKVPRK